MSECNPWMDDKYWTSVLGEGAFGTVFQYQKDPDPPFAIKLVTTDEDMEINIDREYRHLKDKSHPNLVKLFDCKEEKMDAPFFQRLHDKFKDKLTPRYNFRFDDLAHRASRVGGLSTFFIQMEICGPSLRSWLNLRNDSALHGKTWNLIQYLYYQRKMIYGIMSGLQYLHENKVIHRDVRPDNILFSSSPAGEFALPIKIADFGLCRRLPGYFDSTTRHLTSKAGHNLYMAPEIPGKDYDEYVDYYSAGLCIWEIVDIIPNHEIGAKFNRLIQLEDENVVQQYVNIGIAKDLIISMTKRLKEERKRLMHLYVPNSLPSTAASVIDVQTLAAFRFWKDLGPPNRQLVLQKAALEEKHGSFVLNESGVRVIGRYRNKKVNAFHEIGLMAEQCSVEKLHMERLFILGVKNTVTDSTLHPYKQDGIGWIVVTGKENTLKYLSTYETSVKSSKCCIQIDGRDNCLEKIHLSHPLSFNFEAKCILGGQSNTLVQFDFGTDNTATDIIKKYIDHSKAQAAIPTWYKLIVAMHAVSNVITPMVSAGNAIRDGTADTVFLSGTNHIVENVNCRNYICCNGKGMTLKRCKSPLLILLEEAEAQQEMCEFTETVILRDPNWKLPIPPVDMASTGNAYGYPLCPQQVTCIARKTRTTPTSCLQESELWPQPADCEFCNVPLYLTNVIGIPEENMQVNVGLSKTL